MILNEYSKTFMVHVVIFKALKLAKITIHLFWPIQILLKA